VFQKASDLSSKEAVDLGKLISRPCEYPKDIGPLIEFLIKFRAPDVRMCPTVWRVRLLLTSRVWDPKNDTRIWETGSGQIIGFEMLWRRQPNSQYIVLDCFVHPEFTTQKILLEMMVWGD
jgi:hypothetical protein